MELAKPILSVIYKEEEVLRELLQELSVEHLSESFNFASIQRYYSREMGEGLMKIFLSLEGLIKKEELVSFKLWAMKKEKEFSLHGRRRLNIDPGYVDESHLILASSKKRGGRLYLGKGVYAEIEYLFLYGGFRALYWTYADYRDKRVMAFFEKVRNAFLKELKTTKHGNELRLLSFTEY
ncbi:DUF4416 family protein [Hydrogenobacter hydrogenophilus]|uniref:DUF4416 domain-containing protein n=1 Tax=Hydrogenobacter hydrogenophilus TaxID=35835 RepID=A0A285NZB0_9AQUI|nr:DUF4416 family protein [Hydrogenobacter hydrogenophilus]SNZ14800.1 protein of unknown function [Hydrogenobacter hydrogenophilus]